MFCSAIGGVRPSGRERRAVADGGVFNVLRRRAAAFVRR
jgi:hypothetical protein